MPSSILITNNANNIDSQLIYTAVWCSTTNGAVLYKTVSIDFSHQQDFDVLKK